MDERIKTLLLQAWKDERLAAVHIDLQGEYYKREVFAAVDHFSRELRTLKIPNTWVAWPDPESTVRPKVMSVAQYQKTNQSFEYLLDAHIGAQDNETLVTKVGKSALDPNLPLLDKHLMATGIETVILDGVTAKRCLLSTLKDGILTDKYNFIVAADATDMEDEASFKDLVRQASWENLDSFDRRYHSATSGDIIGVLREHAPAPAP